MDPHPCYLVEGVDGVKPTTSSKCSSLNPAKRIRSMTCNWRVSNESSPATSTTPTSTSTTSTTTPPNLNPNNNFISCGKHFHNSHQLRQHINQSHISHNSSSKIINPEYSRKEGGSIDPLLSQPTRSSINLFKKDPIVRPNGDFVCRWKNCHGMRFTTEKDLEWHFERNHCADVGNNIKFSCPYLKCNHTSSKSAQALDNHISINHEWPFDFKSQASTSSDLDSSSNMSEKERRMAVEEKRVKLRPLPISKGKVNLLEESNKEKAFSSLPSIQECFGGKDSHWNKVERDSKGRLTSVYFRDENPIGFGRIRHFVKEDSNPSSSSQEDLESMESSLKTRGTIIPITHINRPTFKNLPLISEEDKKIRNEVVDSTLIEEEESYVIPASSQTTMRRSASVTPSVRRMSRLNSFNRTESFNHLEDSYGNSQGIGTSQSQGLGDYFFPSSSSSPDLVMKRKSMSRGLDGSSRTTSEMPTGLSSLPCISNSQRMLEISIEHEELLQWHFDQRHQVAEEEEQTSKTRKGKERAKDRDDEILEMGLEMIGRRGVGELETSNHSESETSQNGEGIRKRRSLKRKANPNKGKDVGFKALKALGLIKDHLQKSNNSSDDEDDAGGKSNESSASSSSTTKKASSEIADSSSPSKAVVSRKDQRTVVASRTPSPDLEPQPQPQPSTSAIDNNINAQTSKASSPKLRQSIPIVKKVSQSRVATIVPASRSPSPLNQPQQSAAEITPPASHELPTTVQKGARAQSKEDSISQPIFNDKTGVEPSTIKATSPQKSDGRNLANLSNIPTVRPASKEKETEKAPMVEKESEKKGNGNGDENKGANVGRIVNDDDEEEEDELDEDQDESPINKDIRSRSGSKSTSDANSPFNTDSKSSSNSSQAGIAPEALSGSSNLQPSGNAAGPQGLDRSRGKGKSKSKSRSKSPLAALSREPSSSKQTSRSPSTSMHRPLTASAEQRIRVGGSAESESSSRPPTYSQARREEATSNGKSASTSNSRILESASSSPAPNHASPERREASTSREAPTSRVAGTSKETSGSRQGLILPPKANLQAPRKSLPNLSSTGTSGIAPGGPRPKPRPMARASAPVPAPQAQAPPARVPIPAATVIDLTESSPEPDPEPQPQPRPRPPAPAQLQASNSMPRVNPNAINTSSTTPRKNSQVQTHLDFSPGAKSPLKRPSTSASNLISPSKKKRKKSTSNGLAGDASRPSTSAVASGSVPARNRGEEEEREPQRQRALPVNNNLMEQLRRGLNSSSDQTTSSDDDDESIRRNRNAISSPRKKKTKQSPNKRKRDEAGAQEAEGSNNVRRPNSNGNGNANRNSSSKDPSSSSSSSNRPRISNQNLPWNRTVQAGSSQRAAPLPTQQRPSTGPQGTNKEDSIIIDDSDSD